MGRGVLKRLLLQTQTVSVTPRTAGLYLQQSWDPLRLDRGAPHMVQVQTQLQTPMSYGLLGRCIFM